MFQLLQVAGPTGLGGETPSSSMGPRARLDFAFM